MGNIAVSFLKVLESFCEFERAVYDLMIMEAIDVFYSVFCFSSLDSSKENSVIILDFS